MNINLIIGVSELLSKVEVIAYFKLDDSIKPLRIKLQENHFDKVIRISSIIDKKIDKRCGNIMHEFICSSLSENKEHIFTLKYDVAATTWYILMQN